MTIEILLPLFLFVFAATITPGPNNIMVMTSGANFGLKRSLPHLLGISGGVSGIVLVMGLGLITLLDAAPFLVGLFEIASVLYLLWLAYRIATAQAARNSAAGARPLSFVGAAAFQVINPKVWATGVSAITLFDPDRSIGAAMIIAAAYGVIGLLSNVIWAWTGTVLRGWLSIGRRLRFFNVTASGLLVASLYPAVHHVRDIFQN